MLNTKKNEAIEELIVLKEKIETESSKLYYGMNDPMIVEMVIRHNKLMRENGIRFDGEDYIY